MPSGHRPGFQEPTIFKGSLRKALVSRDYKHVYAPAPPVFSTKSHLSRRVFLMKGAPHKTSYFKMPNFCHPEARSSLLL